MLVLMAQYWHSILTLNKPPSQSVPSFPGILVSHIIRLDEPSELEVGLAAKPNGWSLRHALRSSESLPLAIPPLMLDVLL